MKRLVQVCIVIVLVFALAFGSFLAARGFTSPVTGVYCPTVGWNTAICASRAGAPHMAVLLPTLPQPVPAVGWNT